ncbi:hypothetical protein [Sporomusa acidovorans]|uniref:Uncharacterized protein n=1 Tax=Sporomusa acidovorans (strain ATCC 49682 / DSM 3132 / Mol) TaxID=1123286 RepID=A0ABZ3J6B8_SPOA4|nr:hypothetical protein [Sporomusa acidovorans]OZC18243.1 hypothetical protein SPACI_35170 [Sporomusa acidovorans DSM 3132]SDF25748.1 hypothetical protein SAMN04488499_104016 [Sporomusa acidovorans]
MKKSLLVILMITVMVCVISGSCFAKEGDGAKAYAEEQACDAEMNKPVICDKDYPEWGFRAHSWITGTGSNTIAHTQLIDRVNGMVIKEINTRCNYVDPIFDCSGNN